MYTSPPYFVLRYAILPTYTTYGAAEERDREKRRTVGGGGADEKRK